MPIRQPSGLKGSPVGPLDRETPIDLNDFNSMGCSEEGRNSGRTVGDGMVVVRQGIIRQSNEAMVSLSGYRQEEVLDTVFASFFHMDDIPLVESLCGRKQDPGGTDERSVVRLIDKNGEAIPVEISIGTGDGRHPGGHRIVIRHLPRRMTV